ncbi:MAG: GNAT family N-acetyltransferase [Actinomycetota bacterium]|nr:GNAT family N-acetyltransferase [Actinomycetota bacterium]
MAAMLGGLEGEQEMRRRFEADLAHWRRYGFGQWAWRNANGVFVARGGLRYYDLEGERVVELGYSVKSTLWGQGFATEIAQTCTSMGLSELGFRQIVAFTLPTNIASRHVMEKAGFRFSREILHAGRPHVLYTSALSTAT